MALTCNQCGKPVDYFLIETDDPVVGWCSERCYEIDNQEPYFLIREMED